MGKPNILSSYATGVPSPSGKEVPQTSAQELLPEDIGKQLADLDLSPKDIPPKRGQQVVGVAILILVTGLLTWGMLSALGLAPQFGSKWPFAKRSGIILTSANERYVVIVARRNGEDEVRLVDTMTGKVQDISQGDTHASHAALSPDGATVAYVSTSDEGSALYLVGTAGAITLTFSISSLNASALSTLSWKTTKVCEWSGLYWSPEIDRLAFFGCSEQTSALFVASSQADVMPTVVPGTEAFGNESRNAAWLEGGKIVLTSGEKQYDSLILIDLTKQESQRLYGPLK